MSARPGGRLLEREEALSHLDAAVRDGLAGHGTLIVVDGAAGAGKSRLLATLDGGELGATVARAAGGQYEADLAFGVARQLLEPVLGPVAITGTGADVPDDVDVGAILHDLYLRTTGHARTQPLVLVVDDLHWADAPSVRLLAYLARRLQGQPLALVVGVRTGDPAAATLDLRALRPPAVAVERIVVAPLSAAGTVTMLGALLLPDTPPAFAQACHDATGGNPFLVQALARTLRDEGIDPASADPAVVSAATSGDVADWVAGRLAPLGPGAVALADALAILGDGAPPALAARLAELDPVAAATASDALIAAGLLRQGEAAFAHPLVHAAVRDAIPPGRRSLADRRAARLLHDDFGDVARAAAHLRRTPPASEGWAAEVLDAAAERALRDGAPEDAAALWRRCLAEPPVGPARRFGVMLALGRLECALGDGGGLARLREAHALAPDRSAAATVALARCRALQLRGEVDATVDLLEEALVALGDESPALAREIEGELCLVGLTATAVRARTRRRVDAVLAAYAEGERFADIGVLVALAGELAMRGEVDAGLRCAETALAAPGFARRGGAAPPIARSVLPLGEAWERTIEVLDAVLADPRRSTVYAADALTGRALAHLWLGDVPEAEADARAALAFLDGHIVHPSKLATLADALIQRGDIAGALAATQAAARPGPLDEQVLGQMLVGARVRVLVVAGEDAQALAVAARARAFEAAWGIRNPNVIGWRTPAALALHHVGRGDEARALAAQSLAQIAASALPVARASAARTVALVAEGGPDVDGLRAAAGALAATPARLEHAHTLVLLGGALRRVGRRDEAREALADGRERADGCGAIALQETARAELLASGARPRRIARHGADALTPAEDRVARLAAEGLDNPAIADRLVVSRRTVEMHLSNTYRKLGIVSRAALAAALGIVS